MPFGDDVRIALLQYQVKDEISKTCNQIKS